MSIFESISSTYIDAAKSSLPVHRVCVVVAGFFASVVAIEHGASLFESFFLIPLSDLTSLSSTTLKNSSVGNIFLGFLAALLGYLYSRSTISAIFSVALKSTSLLNKVDDYVKKTQPTNMSIADREIALRIISDSLEQPGKRIRSYNQISEMLSGIGCCFIGSAIAGNLTDAFIGAVLLVAVVALNFASVQYFLTNFFGLALYKANLQGKEIPHPTNLG